MKGRKVKEMKKIYIGKVRGRKGGRRERQRVSFQVIIFSGGKKRKKRYLYIVKGRKVKKMRNWKRKAKTTVLHYTEKEREY